jgi:RHS repeat-associated protein
VVTNASGTVEQTLDYFPYGGTRVSSGQNPESRRYIGQFADQSTLDYLQARYYDPSRGQFLSQDQVFWGDPKNQDLMNPQDLNSYSYSVDNPINKSDPKGLWYKDFLTGQQSWPSFQLELGQAANQLSQDSDGWNFAFNHPYTTGALVGLGTYPALVSGGEGIAAVRMATWPGVSTGFAAKQGFAALVYGALTLDTTLSVPGFAGALSQFARHVPAARPRIDRKAISAKPRKLLPERHNRGLFYA